MARFTESDLTFDFPDDWRVRQFDATPAFRSLSGHGLKGVDFLALDPAGAVWFIEVKNYRPRYANETEYRAQRRTPQALADHLTAKFRDSHRLLAIVDRHLEGRWFRRWRFSFWDTAIAAAARPENCRYLVWMETPERRTDYENEVAALMALADSGRYASVRIAEADRPHDLPFRTL